MKKVMPPKNVQWADNMRLGLISKSPHILDRLSKDEGELYRSSIFW